MTCTDDAAPRISLIVAMDRNRVIGRQGALPWRISDDLKYFKATTMGKPVIMGRKTFESIGRPLPGRDNIVVSGQSGYRAPGAEVVGDLEQAVALGLDFASRKGADEAFVIGGAALYAAAAPLVDRIYLTAVRASVEGDVRFPAFDPDAYLWRRAGRARRAERNDHDCDFFILDRIEQDSRSR